jgi:creatinine amidohydrolase/Fe(II)-dependent formamide hydrolase-like protein
MGTESKGSRGADGTGLERAIVLQLLRDDRERMWSRAGLRTELDAGRSEVGEEAFEQALQRLEGEGVLGMSAEAAWASNAARALDELGLISV